MHWIAAIESKRAPLLAIVRGLCAEIGLTEEGTIDRLPRLVHRYVLGILRKAESATRRLIVAAARDIVIEPREPRSSKPRQKPANQPKPDGDAKPKRKRRPLFNLFDPLKRFARRSKKKPRRPQPRISIVDLGSNPLIPLYLVTLQPAPSLPPAVEKADDGMVSAASLVRRLMACADALQDIPRHALRLAHWLAQDKEDRRPERWSPLRPGRPPGYRQRNLHAVDEILKDCNWLAHLGNKQFDDTS
jgi:hypothetical protein